jgi:hypothetical protein
MALTVRIAGPQAAEESFIAAAVHSWVAPAQRDTLME